MIPMVAVVIFALFVSLCCLGAAFIVREERNAWTAKLREPQPMPPYAAKYFEQLCSESELEQLNKERWQD